MNRRQIAYFLGVAECESFSRASERLNVSQPALSARIGELERDIGQTLFDRRPHGVTLTDAGRRFLPHARAIETAFADAADAMRAPRETGRLVVRIGVTPTVGAGILPILLEVSGGLTPEIDWPAQQAASARLIELLARGEIDAALGYLKTAGTRAQRLFSDDMALVGTPAVMGAGSPDIGFAELARFDLVLDQTTHPSRRIVDAAMARAGVSLRVSAEIEPLPVKKGLVLDRGFCTIVPRHVFAPELAAGTCVARRIVSPRLPLTLYLLLGKALDDQRCDRIRRAVLGAVARVAKPVPDLSRRETPATSS